MTEPLTCEKLIADGKKRKMLSYPYRCGRRAVRYRVSGDSYSAIAVLCGMHRACAEREGFKLAVDNG